MKFSEFFAHVNIADGFSFDLLHGCAPSNGYAVSIFKGLEQIFNGCPTLGQLVDYALANYDVLVKTEHGYADFPAMWGYDVIFGGWLDGETGKYYLDCSIVVPSLSEALQLARQHDQLAVFNLATFETIYA